MSTTATPRSAAPAPVAAARTTAPDHTPSWGTLLVLLAGVFITTLDFFIVNVAIPATQADLGASSAAIQWVVAGYGLALAGLLITGGRLGDMAGRRRMFMIGLGAFTIASAACGLAQNPEMLIVSRVAQGASAALLMPQVLGILNVVYTGQHRARAFMAYGLTIGFAGVFGQLIGGGLIEIDLFGLDWRSIYWINVPVGIAALVMTPRLVPESKGTGGTRLDLVGAVLVTGGLVAVVLPLVQGREQGWPLWTWLSLAAAPVLIAEFAWYQRRLARRDAAPLIDLEMFKERSFSAGLAVTLAYSLAMASFFLVLALYLQMGHGMTALNSGLLFMALGVGYFIGAAQAEKIAARLGRQVLTLGAVLTAGGYAVLAETVAGIGATGSVMWLIPGLALAGYGMGVALAPMSAIVLAGITPKHAASAAGVLTTAQQVGGALGVAVVGIVFYDALGTGLAANDYAHAVTWALIPLTIFCVATAALVQLLPKPAARD
ncbi:MFS transporter [Yinghuangia seranimata]|uniref:MFS transporter n=1 Tax=Yinghuangia seranimata TaxID=408067 RepID=UPI00248CAF40|nr:MFS transporter [Yinghuangia seranimata]MDI2130022.1 MFS transporter [Yinghuangia seranimata]